MFLHHKNYLAANLLSLHSGNDLVLSASNCERKSDRTRIKRSFPKWIFWSINTKVQATHRLWIQVGWSVLIDSEDRKRMDWPLACVKDLIPGKDGEVCKLKERIGQST